MTEITSSKLVLLLDPSKRTITFSEGITQVNAHSNLTNEIVVRPVEGDSPCNLLVGQSLWIRLEYKATPTLRVEDCMLTKRLVTKPVTTTEIITDNSATGLSSKETTTQQPTQQYEYYMQLPQAVLQNAGEWLFALSIRVASDDDRQVVASTGNYSLFVYDSLVGSNGNKVTEQTVLSMYEFTDDVLNAFVQNNGFAPYIGDNGNWWQWDNDLKLFVDTGVLARVPVVNTPIPDDSPSQSDAPTQAAVEEYVTRKIGELELAIVVSTI